MTLAQSIRIGIVGTAIVALGGVLFFYQSKDPIMITLSTRVIATLWAIVLGVHLITHGIPVRLVHDERR